MGSSNIDPFSLMLAREANVVVQDADFAADLRSSLLGSIKRDGRRVELARSNLVTRLLALVSYGLIRFIIGVLRISKRH